ncbi:hypothetical protein GE061_009657 [Apolygus lucorum]|uniref:EGF-like domain-containing protein n=1 Tax=Apolygus lucorum TaxID=248454 RepID=A0A8S9Y0U6_APOLU|nr:hypothetical protein GE061_009657 [Apolygus lucorum]
MDKITQLYLESIRFHIGFTGSLKFSEGTTTAFGSVVTAQSIHEWTKTVLNNYQPIGVSVNLPADQFDDNELLYLGVFVEILVPHAITTPVHIVLLAHETSRKVRGTIDVVFKVNGTNRKELRSKWIIPRRQEKRITIIEIQLDSEPDLNGEKFHRQVKVNFVCNVRVRAILLNHVPTYSEVEPVIPALKGDFFMVVQNLSLYIGVIPPERVESQTTIVFFLRLSQFVCTQKYTNTPWDLNSVSSSRICSIITTAIVDDQSVTCSCPGSGLIKTQSLDVRARIYIIKSPPDSRNWIERVTDSRDLNYVIIAWVIIGLLVVLFGWYRDKVTYKRELIQMLPDTFPADQYAYICGVFTGSKLWAGTTAHVGIQIMGSNAISRVHILTSNSYKVLQWCFDDWFAIFTPDNLGRLNYVKLWQDYSEACPDWYCAKIMVYSVEHQSWTIFQVERWLTISKTRDMTSFALIQGRKYIPERELCEKFSFCQHYWNEIRNTHSLLSPFTKQRRFVFSHLMRASLTGTFLMSLISTVILVDFAFLHMGIIADNCSNIIIRAIIASLIASIPYTIATFFFTRSVVKMKKTKLLDLHYLEQIKRSEEFQQPRLSISNPRRSSLSHFSVKSQGEKSSMSSEDLRLEYKSSKTSTTTHKNRKHMSAKRGNQFSSNNYSISMQKWIPSSIYRPVRVGNYDLKRKGMVAHVFGCITVAGSFTANMVFIVWFISVGFPESRTGSLTAAIAVVFEFIRSSLVVLLLSYHAVYISKRCNYEVSCLDLTGLQNTAKIVNHEQFLKNRTKPYYHPLSDTEMLALYKKRQKTRFFRMLVGFSGFYCLLMLSTSFLYSVTDTSSIYRLGAFNTHAYTEPVINNLTKSTKLLKDVRTIDDIYEYAQSTLLPIKTVTHWYNNRPMQTRMLWKKKKYWFLDRNSVQFTLSTLTILRATNQSRVNISRYFQDTNLDLFKTAYGHVDTSGKYKIKYNRWQQSEMIPSHVTQDRILNNGLIGIQGIFYPSSIGDEIYVRPAASLADVKNYFEKLISRNSRAIILKCVLVHLGYTPQPLSPIGYTIIDVLFENYASGIYTGSVRANFLVGRSSKSQLKAGLVSGFCTIVIFIPILMKIVFDGFKACFGKVVYWLLLIGVVNNAVGSSALIWMYFFLRTPGVNVNDAVWSDERDEEEELKPCYCGYGGVCRFKNGEPLKWNCSNCETVSEGLYYKCWNLFDHCARNPCLNNGRCVMTFGSFFCDCLPGFVGHTCQYARNEQEIDLETVVGPRAWYQVNRIGPVINQAVHFTFEQPGDNIRFHVRYDDGRFLDIQATRFKFTNARQDCIRDVEENSQERDIRVCETLPDKFVYSVKLNSRYFLDYHDQYFETMEAVYIKVDRKKVLEGRVNRMHVVILNMNKLTFSQEYLIHTSFELKPKCKYRLSFVGCARSSHHITLHDRGDPIYLTAIREPVDNCSVGVFAQSFWKLPGKSRIETDMSNYTIQLRGDELRFGRNFIDFLLVVRGSPPYHGSPELSFNYARCWFRVVMGKFRVGVLGGRDRMVPCVTPLTLRLFSINSNFKENELASEWRCKPAELQNCEFKRFLGSKIFFRTLPCDTTILFRSMVIHIPTGHKYFITSEIRTSIHVDTLRCHCVYNCERKIDPRSKARFWVSDDRLSTERELVGMKWTATLSGVAFDISPFIISGSMGRGIQIDTGAFTNSTWFKPEKPLFSIRAQRKDLFCTILLEIDIPPLYTYGQVENKTRMTDVEDVRYSIRINNAAFNKLIEPVVYEAREIVSPKHHETIRYITAQYQKIRYLKMALPTYIVARNYFGLQSNMSKIHRPQAEPVLLTLENLNDRIRVISKLVSQGSYNVALTELMYCTRDVMMQKHHYFVQKIKLLESLKQVLKFTLLTSSSILLDIERVLNIINRLTTTKELTKPPFNIDVHPWVIPHPYVRGLDILLWLNMHIRSAGVLRDVSKRFYGVSAQDSTTRRSSVMNLLYDALLRTSMVWLRRTDYQKNMSIYSLGRKLEFDARMNILRAHFRQTVNYLQRAIDYHIDGFTGTIKIETGSVTVYGTVMLARDVHLLAYKTFNDYQEVKIRVEIMDQNIKSFTSIYFSVYVELPVQDRMTTGVHVYLVTHSDQNIINSTIETQMKIHKQDNIENDRESTIIAYIENPSYPRDAQKYITTYKIGLPRDPFLYADHQIDIHLKSDVEVVIGIDPKLPQYDELQNSEARGSGRFNLSTVTDKNVFYLGLIPGDKVPPGSPQLVTVSVLNIICAVRQPLNLVNEEDSDERTDQCQIVQTKKFTTVGRITCVCPGGGVVDTHRSEVTFNRVFADSRPDSERNYQKNLWHDVILLFPIPFLGIFLIACIRDKRNEKKEFIQILDDAFPGDSHPYIVGVYTGKKLLSGTSANVAIHVDGLVGNSRIHILKSENYRTLGRTQDDWFMIYTKEHMGKLTFITLWHDFKHLWPEWYCCQIVIYDVEQTAWYRFPVHRWVGKISEGPELARSMTVPGLKFQPEMDCVASFSIWKHFGRVMRNLHPLLSVIFKHRRHMHSHRLRATNFALLTIPYFIEIIFFDRVMNQDIPWRSFIIANIANVIHLIPSLPVSYLQAHSFAKSRKTKRLDLRRINELKEKDKMRYQMSNSPDSNATKHSLQFQLDDGKLQEDSPDHKGLDGTTLVYNYQPKKNLFKSRDTKLTPSHSILKSKTSLSERSDSPEADLEDATSTRHSRGKIRGSSPSRSKSQTRSSRASDRSQSIERERIQFSMMHNIIINTPSPKSSGSVKHWKPPSDTNWDRHYTSTASKWIPEAFYRPIRFENELSYIRYGGRGYQIAAWVLSLTVIFLGIIFAAAYCTFGEKFDAYLVCQIFVLALAIQWFFYAPLYHFTTSLVIILHDKWCNLECHILELGGLPANDKRINHIQFMNRLTQPEYHPQKTETLERLHKQYRKASFLKLIALFLLVFNCFLMPAVWVIWESDMYSFFRVENSTKEALQESTGHEYAGYSYIAPVSLSMTHDRNEMSTYLQTVFLPATRTLKWYNNRPLTDQHGFTWFADRSSKMFGSVVIRVISASNNTKQHVASIFKQMFTEATYDFDMYGNHSIFIHDWTKVHDHPSGFPLLRKIMGSGIYGKSGIFYPQHLGREILLREDKQAANLFTVLQRHAKGRVRAMIIDLHVIHPSVSTSRLNPPYSFTRVQILFEKPGGGIFSGSVHTIAKSVRGSPNYLRIFSLLVFLSIDIFFASYLGLKICSEGFISLKEFRVMTLTVIVFLSFVNFGFLLWDAVLVSHTVQDNITQRLDVFNRIDFEHHVIGSLRTQFAEVTIACQLFLQCLLLVDFVNEATGFMKRVRVNVIIHLLTAYLMVVFCSFVLEVALTVEGENYGRMPYMEVDITAIKCERCAPVLYAYIYLWIAALTITTSCQIIAFKDISVDKKITDYQFSLKRRLSETPSMSSTRINSEIQDTKATGKVEKKLDLTSKILSSKFQWME